MAQGYLQVDVVSDANSFPVQDADIVVTSGHPINLLSRVGAVFIEGKRVK